MATVTGAILDTNLALRQPLYTLSRRGELGLNGFRPGPLLGVRTIQEAIHVDRLAKFDVRL